MNIPISNRKAANLARCVAGNTEEFLAKLQNHPEVILDGARVANCVEEGYAPRGYGLADFTIVRRGSLFHLFHIPRVPGNSCIDRANEHWLAHAISEDLETWISQDPALCVEPNNYYESGHLWAPFVIEDAGVHYMFYTGLSSEPSQVLCLATSTDPALRVWQRHEANPILPVAGLDWQRQNSFGHLRQGRDPHVVRVGDHFLMVYTTMHREGCPVVGGMVSPDLVHWEDIGPILYRPLLPNAWMPESINIQSVEEGKWVLLASMSPGLEVYFGNDPHSWHDAKAEPIAYSEAGKTPVAPEFLARRNATTWLVAYFEQEENRMFLGELDLQARKLRRMRGKSELETWKNFLLR